MTRVELRIWGDPFADGESSRALRALLAQPSRHDMRIGLCLTGVRGDPTARRTVRLWNGASGFAVGTDVAEPELDRIVETSRVALSDSAALVVFGSNDDVLTASLEFPNACCVLPAAGRTTEQIVEGVVNFVTSWPADTSDDLVPAEELEPFSRLPLAAGHERRVLHVCGEHAAAELVAEIVASLPLELGVRPRLHGADRATRDAFTDLFGASVEFTDGELRAEVFDGTLAVLQPTDAAIAPRLLAIAMASGRPLLCSRFGVRATELVESGFGVPLGGRTTATGFAADPRSATTALIELATKPSTATSMAERARARVVERLIGPRPAPPPAEVRESSRPLVVLEAPLFETSSSSHLTLETARALVRRDEVDVLLRPRTPFQGGVDDLARRAPELVSRVVRRAPRCDLWLSTGWPVRAARPPQAATFALRVDYEYGALPTELTPHVTDLADRVVVHSNFVRRLVTAAGTPASRVEVVPHGVDVERLRPTGDRFGPIESFKRGRQALLYVGGPIWRKGFDLVVGTALQSFSDQDEVCLVVKTLGSHSDYAGFELGGLLERMRAVPRAIDVLVLDEELTPDELAQVYRSCDALLHPYRGEGFCLPVLEARACGLPVVTTEGGSTEDFCDGEAVFKIPSTRRPIELPQPHEAAPFVLEPDAAAIAALARRALQPGVRALAVGEADAVRQHFTWDAAATSIERLAREASVRARVTA